MESQMTTKTEFDVLDDQTAECTREADAIELSLSDLDMVAGGAVGLIFQ
jgi:hypothetical protein